MDAAQQARRQPAALACGAVFVQQNITESLLEAIYAIQRRMLREIVLKLSALRLREVGEVAAHQREQAPILGAGGIELAPERQEMLVDEANDMEAVGHDQGVGKVLAHDGAVGGGQVHADDADQLFAGQALKISFQGGFAAAEHDVEHGMVLEIAQRGGVALLTREEVLVDTEDVRALAARGFRQQAGEAMLKMALYGGG